MVWSEHRLSVLAAGVRAVDKVIESAISPKSFGERGERESD